MKLQSILGGRAVRLQRFIQPLGGMHLSKVVAALQERYSFVKVPRALEEFDETRGVEFQHGKFTVIHDNGPKDIVVDKFTVYTDGVVADTRSYTEDADAFIDDVIKWSISTLGISIPSSQIVGRYYISNLEVVLESNLGEYISASTVLADQLAGCMAKYGLKFGSFEVTGINMNFDRTSTQSLLSAYTLQRREGIPFESKLYFSSAPLKTRDHISMLEVLDRKNA